MRDIMKNLVAAWLRRIAHWLDPLPRVREYTINLKPGVTFADLFRQHPPPSSPFTLSLDGKVVFEGTTQKP
jgi:hypothetical protein